MIYQICGVIMSICIFEYLLNHNSLTHQTWLIDRYNTEQYFFWKLLNDLEDWG